MGCTVGEAGSLEEGGMDYAESFEWKVVTVFTANLNVSIVG